MNLIICCTPLQVLIAEKIIEQYPNEHFFGLMLAPLMNDKYQYYAKKLQKQCHTFELIVENSYSKIGLIKKLKSFSKWLNHNYNIDKFFIANLNKFFIQGLLSYVDYQEYHTFDDGTANLVGFKNKKDMIGISYQIIKKILGIHDDINAIRCNSKSHFSIYADNACHDTIKIIDLFANKSIKPVSNQKSISLLLGQPLFKDNHKNIQTVKMVLQALNIDYYFPHPRENYIDALDTSKIIVSELIFEAYILQLLKAYSDIKVYYFFSTAGLNVANVQNVELICLYSPDFDIVDKTDIKRCYDIFQNRKIKRIDIDKIGE